MKTMTVVLLTILVCVSFALGDEAHDGLSNITPLQIRTSTRQMIQSGVDKDGAIRMTRLMLQNRFREEEILRAHQMVMNAKRRGLPVGPIMDKAFEGMTKRVEARNIVRAMEAVQNRYAIANKYANRITKEGTHRVQTQNAIANCFAAGLREKNVQEMIEALQHRARSETVTTAQFGELAARTFAAARDTARLGVSPEVTTELFCQAIQHRYKAREIQMMSRSLATQSRRVAPNILAERYTHAIRGGQPAHSLGALGMEGGSRGHGDSGHGGGGSGGGGGGGR